MLSKSASSSSATMVARPVWMPWPIFELTCGDDDRSVRLEADVGMNLIGLLLVRQRSPAGLGVRGQRFGTVAGSEHGRYLLDGLFDARIGSTTAEVAIHPGSNLRLTR